MSADGRNPENASATQSRSDSAARTGEPHWTVKAVLLLVATMTVLAGAIISPSLPAMDRFFVDRSEVAVQLILTTPALAIAVFGTLMGLLADRLNRRALLLAALAVYGAAGFAGFVVDGYWTLMGSRLLLGIAVATLMGVSTVLVGEYFGPQARTRFMGVQASFMALGGVVFMTLGGVLADISWRGPFLVYLSAFVILPLAWAVLSRPASGMSGEGSTLGASGEFQWRIAALVYLLAFLGMALFYMLPSQVPFLLAHRGDYSGVAISLAVVSGTATSAVASYLYGPVRARLSFVGVYVAAFALVAVGYLVLGSASGFAIVAAGAAISGLGFGLMMPNAGAWLMAITPDRIRGRVLGTLVSAFFVGQFLSPIMVAPVVARVPLQDVFVIAAGVAVLVTGTLWAGLRRRA